jgi:hypothetical protein
MDSLVQFRWFNHASQPGLGRKIRLRLILKIMNKLHRLYFTKLRFPFPRIKLFTEAILVDPNGKLEAGYFRINVSRLVSESQSRCIIVGLRPSNESLSNATTPEYHRITAESHIGQKLSRICQYFGGRSPAMPLDNHIHRMKLAVDSGVAHE